MIDKMTGRWIPDFMGQQPWQDRELMGMIAQQMGQTAQAPSTPQAMKPVTIRADIIQFTDPAEVQNYQVTPGTSQMFMNKEETLIIIREQGQNGYSLKNYPLQPPEAKKPPIDPAKFVTKDELEQRLAAFTDARPARSALNKGEE